MQIQAKTTQNLDKFTLRKMQASSFPKKESIPDSLEAWMLSYLEFAIEGVRSEAVTQKIALHLRRFQAFFFDAYGHDRLSACLRRDVQAWQQSTQGISLRTIQRWMQAYRTQGLVGLAKAERSDQGKRRGMPTTFVQLIEGLALQTPKRSAAAIHRQVSTIAAEQGWISPTYSRVYDIIRHLDPALTTLAHEGAKAYAETFDLVYRREASHANSMWQADHTLLLREC